MELVKIPNKRQPEFYTRKGKGGSNLFFDPGISYICNLGICMFMQAHEHSDLHIRESNHLSWTSRDIWHVQLTNIPAYHGLNLIHELEGTLHTLSSLLNEIYKIGWRHQNYVNAAF